MRLFLDTDILLDVLLKREPFFDTSRAVLDWAEANPGDAAVSCYGLANLHYLSANGAEPFIRDLLKFVEIPPVGTVEMLSALDLDFSDLEDAMQAISARIFGAHFVVTRNTRHFHKSPIPARTPKRLISHL